MPSSFESGNCKRHSHPEYSPGNRAPLGRAEVARSRELSLRSLARPKEDRTRLADGQDYGLSLRIMEIRQVERGGSAAGDRAQAGQACPLREGSRASCAHSAGRAEEEVHESVFRRGPVLDHTCLHQHG
jgi:hypothetical protein